VKGSCSAQPLSIKNNFLAMFHFEINFPSLVQFYLFVVHKLDLQQLLTVESEIRIRSGSTNEK